MLILVMNCGSSSVKYKLYDMSEEQVLISGLVERIGLAGSALTQQSAGKEKVAINILIPNHRVAIENILKWITDPLHGVVSNVENIYAVGHRVVHGGERFNSSVEITPDVLSELESLSELAPLHNPPNITGIKVCSHLMPKARQVAVFDTAFHQTIPAQAYMYGLPYEYYSRFGIRKYGFHGTSHRYVSARAAELLKREIEELKIITCHLGNGSSLCAVKGGKSLDTSMGFTPLAGLLMGTRTGDMDPAIVPFIMEKEGMTISQLNELLNKRSGVLGISGISSDFRDLERTAGEGNRRAQLALDMFCYNVQKWIGSFTSVLGGLDVLVLTGGIGENSPYIRSKIIAGLSWLGIKIDDSANKTRGREVFLNSLADQVRVIAIPTNEELLIARDTHQLTGFSDSGNCREVI